ncbi:MAG TPA: hypothetical protein PLI09_02255 [Candidatus Hydrogenedentes bacterium]|nr:hypothetical protein [Candidatus Hydrogenedentota bacterium]
MQKTRPALAESVDAILYVIQQIIGIFSQFVSFIEQMIKFLTDSFGG